MVLGKKIDKETSMLGRRTEGQKQVQQADYTSPTTASKPGDKNNMDKRSSSNKTTSSGKRGRKMSEFESYTKKTQKKIADLYKRMEATTDKNEAKRLRNMAGAYNTRLNKRVKIETL